MQRITGGWHAKLTGALDKGYAGMRVSGNAFWIEGNYWKQFCEYEQELDLFAGRPKDDRAVYLFAAREQGRGPHGCRESASAVHRAAKR